MKQVTLNVEGMSCGHCVNSIETALKEIGTEAKVDLSSKKVSVEFDDTKLNESVIKETIEEQGYDVV
jgi:copper chaperone